MPESIVVKGHAWERCFFYTEGSGNNAVFHYYTAPGGAALIAQMLAAAGIETDPIPTNNGYRREYLELKKVSKSLGGVIYLVARPAGYSSGCLAAEKHSSSSTVVWDEGWTPIEMPPQGEVLWCSRSVLPSPEVMQQLGERAFLLLDAGVLRESGAMISRQVSWERSATDLVWQLKNNPSLSHLLQASHILISFAEDGAVYLQKNDSEHRAVLVLAHGGAEGSQGDSVDGTMPDTWAMIVFQTALQFSAVMKASATFKAQAGLQAAGALWRSGYSPDLLASGQVLPTEPITAAEGLQFDIPDLEGGYGDDSNYWCIPQSFQHHSLFALARRIVLEGLSALKGMPRMNFGALTTVDRQEIEAFHNIKNLILSYAGNNSVRPLSIAVFGSPGSGKSFGVTQIAQHVLPGKVEKVEFNVSQFSSPADLTAAFHIIRDVVLEDKIPLVFFDEFDSDRNGQPLGWLKSFLMPMQDGKFKDGSEEHPVGKCIFVFAGGTSSSFQQFAAPLQASEPERREAFKNIKGPDFISRLRGTIDVLGPNPIDVDDKNYILRRALLLRSMCERKFKLVGDQHFIDESVLRAMLLVPEYRHGARSMESILDMSRIEGRVWEPASLPFSAQLALHVDADAFIRLVLRDVKMASYTEILARAIHNYYVQRQQRPSPASDQPNLNPWESYLIGKYEGSGALSDQPNLSPWEELEPSLRASNIRQARDIAQKLLLVHCDYDAGDTPYASVETFSPEEIEQLAEMEHELWMEERKKSGWVYGSNKDTEAKITPYLVDWAELTEELRELDRETARNIIPLLRSVGLRVYRAI